MQKKISADELFEVRFRPVIQSAVAVEMTRRVLLNAGVDPLRIIECRSDGAVSLGIYLETAVAVKRLCAEIRRSGIKGVRVTSQRVFRKDWQDQWKKDFHPFAITPKVDIVPVWHKKSYRPNGREPIFLETNMAFGTGLHETTRFMARLIERCAGKFQDFLDIGTGSGILALLALKCGVSKVLAIEIEAQSVEVARQNLRRNRFSPAIVRRADLDKWPSRARFGFVAANLVTDDLIRMRRKILARVRPGGFLALSGISLGNLARLQKAFGQFPLRCVCVLKGKYWTAVLYQVRQDKGKA